MRHATDQDLDRLEELLVELRKLPALRERKRGSFSRGAHAFAHFHADSGQLYVDVKLRGSFERLPVTTPEDQATFLLQLRRAIHTGTQALP